MFSITPLLFDAPSPRNPLEYRYKPYIARNYSHWATSLSQKYRSIFIQIFTVSSERSTCFETECIMTLKGHPRSLILAPIESAYMISYSTSIVTLVLSCRVSEILELLYAESRFFSTPPLFGQKFRVFPIGANPSCWGCKERTSQAN